VPRMKSKDIKAFVRRSIRAESFPADIAELQRLLDQMSTSEMHQFWMHFAADRAFSSTLSVPHWKTKEQQVRFEHEHLSWMFYPKEKDTSGKHIIVRQVLEEHIKTCLLRHIEQERLAEQAFRMRPLFDRFHARLGLTIVIMAWAAIPLGICLLIVEAFFHVRLLSAVATLAVSLFVMLYILYLLLPIMRALLQKCRIWKESP
jgi:hypothetical protein